MGTDIHLEVEVMGEDGLWHWIEHPDRPCDDEFCTGGKYNEHVPNKSMVGNDHFGCRGKGHYIDQFWNDRNYDVFAMLANVRNGVGFAGIDTGDGFVPIANPRGLPSDLSSECRAGDWSDPNRPVDEDDEPYDYEAWNTKPDLGEHSQSWLTVAELLAYDWAGQTTKKRGWVDPWNFELWRRNGKPNSWSGSVEGARIDHIGNAHMAHLIDSGEIEWEGPEPDTNGWSERPYSDSLQRSMREMGEFPEGSFGAGMAHRGTSYYTHVEWEVPYSYSAQNFLKVLHRDIVPLGHPDKVRIVFGFDS